MDTEPTLALAAGLKALRDSVDVFGEGNPLTALCPKIDDVTDPDDAFSSVGARMRAVVEWQPYLLMS